MTVFARRRPATGGAMPRRMLLLTGLLCALLLAGFLWWHADPRVTPPVPDAQGAAVCRALDRALPHSLQGTSRRDPQPASPYTAAWASDPRTVLTCGGPVPEALEHPDPSERGGEVNGVDWLAEDLGGGAYRFTTIERRASVQVTVPAGAYPHASDVLPGISDAVARTDPSRFTQ